MKIIFNVMNCGLGNNGGSQTIIKSANTLVDLGHDITIVDTGKNQHTWNSLKAKHLIIKDYTQIPEADAIIATGIKTVISTNKCIIKNKYHWIRAHETWDVLEKDVVEIIKKSDSLKIVNSICLQNKLKQFGVDSNIIRPGYDFEDTFPLNIRKENKKIILGGLNCSKKRKRVHWIFEVFRELKKKYDVELYMYGTEEPLSTLINFYRKNPDPNTKNMIYNKVDIWMAPTNSEGLHIPPAESGLTNGCVVVTNAELSGTQDYITSMETGLVSTNDMNSFFKMTEFAILMKELREVLGRNLREKVLSIGSRKDNMKKLINLLEG